MSTSDINKKKRIPRHIKTVIVYIAVSVFCVIFDKVYALFGHGVQSDAMTYMFLYPLIGGAAVYFLLGLLNCEYRIENHFRFSFNLYNSGIATLTVRSSLKGIFEIAGTDSKYLIVFTVCGFAMIALSCISYIAFYIIHTVKKANSMYRKKNTADVSIYQSELE